MDPVNPGEFNVKRIAFLKLGAIGDVVMALPILAALRERHPDCVVDWIVGTVAAPVLRAVDDPLLNIVEIDERPLYRGSVATRLGAILGLWKRLGTRRYDLVLIGNSDPRYGLMVLPCRGPRRWFRESPTHRAAVPGRHHSAEYVRMLSGVDDSELPWPTYPPLSLPEPPPGIADVLAALRGPLVAISPAGARNTMREEGLRRWTVEGYRAVMVGLRANGCSLVLVGGPGDEWASESFGDLCDLDLVAKAGLGGFLGMLGRMDLLVTHDSGPLHLADLAGTPVVGLFGPTVAEEKRPIAVRHEMLSTSSELACRPCYDGHRYADCSRPLCMTTIEPSRVVEAALRLLHPTARLRRHGGSDVP